MSYNTSNGINAISNLINDSSSASVQRHCDISRMNMSVATTPRVASSLIIPHCKDIIHTPPPMVTNHGGMHTVGVSLHSDALSQMSGTSMNHITVSPISSPALTSGHPPTSLVSPVILHSTSTSTSRGWPMDQSSSSSASGGVNGNAAAMPPRHAHHVANQMMINVSPYMVHARDLESPISQLSRGVARVAMQSPLPQSPTSSPSPALSSSSEPLESPPHNSLASPGPSPSPTSPLSHHHNGSGGRGRGRIYHRSSKSRSQSFDVPSAVSSSSQVSSSSASSRSHTVISSSNNNGNNGGHVRPSARRPLSSGSSRSASSSLSSNNVSTPSEVRIKSLSGSAPPSGRSSVAQSHTTNGNGNGNGNGHTSGNNGTSGLPSQSTSMVTRSYSNESSSSHTRTGSGDSLDGITNNNNGMSIHTDQHVEFPRFASHSAPGSNLSSPTSGTAAITSGTMFRSISHSGVMSPAADYSRSPSPLSAMGSPRAESPYASSPNRSPSSSSPIMFASSNSRAGSCNDLRGFAAANAVNVNNEAMIDARRANGYRAMQPPALTMQAPNNIGSARNSPMNLLRYLPQRSPTTNTLDDDDEVEILTSYNHNQRAFSGSQIWGNNGSTSTALSSSNTNTNGGMNAREVQQPQPRLSYALCGSGHIGDATRVRTEPGTPLNWNSSMESSSDMSMSSSNGSYGPGGVPISAFPVTPQSLSLLIAPMSSSSSSSAMDTTSEREDDGNLSSILPDMTAFTGSPARPQHDSFAALYTGVLPLGQISPSPPRLVPQSGVPLITTPRAAPVISLFGTTNNNDIPSSMMPMRTASYDADDHHGLRRPLSVSIDDSASPPSGSPANGTLTGSNLNNSSGAPLTDSHAVLMRRTRSEITPRFIRNLFDVTSEESAAAMPLQMRRTPTPSPRDMMHGAGSSSSTSSSSSLASSASSSPQRPFHHFNGSMSMAPPSSLSMSRSQSVGGHLSTFQAWQHQQQQHHAAVSAAATTTHHVAEPIPSGRLEPEPTHESMPPSPSRRQRGKLQRRQQALPTYAVAPVAVLQSMQQRSQTPTAAVGRRMAGQIMAASAWDRQAKVTTEAGGRMITHATLASLLRGERKADFDRVLVIDCRFPYEYDGGHIRGAINLTSEVQARTLFFDSPAPSDRTVIIFHCEFSQQRGPRGWQWLRETDRTTQGLDHFGELFYPELYILKDGYRDFHRAYPALCERTTGSAAWIAPPADIPASLPAGSTMAEESLPTAESYGSHLYTPMLHPQYSDLNRQYQKQASSDWPRNSTGSVRNARR